MLPDPPETGNEDPVFLELAGRKPLVYLIAEVPLRRDDPDGVAEAKAVTVAEEWARQQGVPFGGVLPQREPKRRAS